MQPRTFSGLCIDLLAAALADPCRLPANASRHFQVSLRLDRIAEIAAKRNPTLRSLMALTSGSEASDQPSGNFLLSAPQSGGAVRFMPIDPLAALGRARSGLCRPNIDAPRHPVPWLRPHDSPCRAAARPAGCIRAAYAVSRSFPSVTAASAFSRTPCLGGCSGGTVRAHSARRAVLSRASRPRPELKGLPGGTQGQA
jgi:hypothetical protein